MKRTRIILQVVVEDHPRKGWQKRWSGAKRLRNWIAKAGGLSHDKMNTAKRVAHKIAEHPMTRSVRIIRRTETELWMIAQNGYTFAITKDQAGVLG